MQTCGAAGFSPPGTVGGLKPAAPQAPSGSAHETHLAVSILGNAVQHAAQHDATRASQESSSPQATHHDGRTIRTASRPKYDKALAIRVGTRQLYSRTKG